jgi:DNA-binding response OmpR family regulator
MKSEPDFQNIGIIFAAAPVDKFDETDARNAGADHIMRKPFEASALLGAVQSLLDRRASLAAKNHPDGSVLDRNSVRAAVTLALDSAMPALIDELTERVIMALSNRR